MVFCNLPQLVDFETPHAIKVEYLPNLYPSCFHFSATRIPVECNKTKTGLLCKSWPVEIYSCIWPSTKSSIFHEKNPYSDLCLPACLDNWIKLWQCPLVWMASDWDFTAALLLVKRAPLNLLFLSYMTLTVSSSSYLCFVIDVITWCEIILHELSLVGVYVLFMDTCNETLPENYLKWMYFSSFRDERVMSLKKSQD